MKLSKNFTLAEMTSTSTGFDNTPTHAQIVLLEKFCQKVLQPIRDGFGVPVQVNSGYRSPAVNKAVGGARSSDHMIVNGYVAADIVISSAQLIEIIKFVLDLELPVTKLILEPSWVHISSHQEVLDGVRVMEARKTSSGIIYKQLEV